MGQKYKFFIKDKVIVIDQKAESEPVSVIDLSELVFRIRNLEMDTDMFLSVDEPEKWYREILSSFKYIKAAGGYVLNKRGQLLMIYRRGFWDLPKGKQDPGEEIDYTAVREVREECGVYQLDITSGSFSTFHLYKERGQVVVKESVWFAMITNDEELIPQTEEDILEARWVDLPVSRSIREGCYSSIVEVLDHFKGQEP